MNSRTGWLVGLAAFGFAGYLMWPVIDGSATGSDAFAAPREYAKNAERRDAPREVRVQRPPRAPRIDAGSYQTRVERVRAFFGREITEASREFAHRGSCADERMIAAVIATEVGGFPTKEAMVAARGGVGEIGPMQIHPDTAAALGVSTSEIAIPENNLRTGIRYLCDLVREWGSIPAGLAAYNAGPGRYAAILVGGGMPHELEYPTRVARHAAELGLRLRTL